MVVWSTPEFDEVYDASCPRTYVKELKSFCEREGVRFVDIVPHFQKAIGADAKLNLYEWAPVDCHPTRHGYGIIARRLSEEILAE